MENQIEIKSIFTNWHKVDKETAKKFIKHLLDGAVVSNHKYIEKNFLKGITIKELLGE